MNTINTFSTNAVAVPFSKIGYMNYFLCGTELCLKTDEEHVILFVNNSAPEEVTCWHVIDKGQNKFYLVDVNITYKLHQE